MAPEDAPSPAPADADAAEEEDADAAEEEEAVVMAPSFQRDVKTRRRACTAEAATATSPTGTVSAARRDKMSATQRKRRRNE